MRYFTAFFWKIIAVLSTIFIFFYIAGCENANLTVEKADSELGKIEFLNVGQGLSVFLSTENGENAMLFDAGNDSTGFWDSLKTRNVKHLDWALLSHWHRDHAGAFLEWDGNVQIDTLFYSADTGGKWLRDSVLRLAKKFKTPAVRVKRGRRLDCAAWSCKILWSPEFQDFDGNNASAVLQISDGKQKALFMGDLEKDAEAGLLEISADLHADLLQVGHHGSKNSSSLAFLEAVSPVITIISVGKSNNYGHPAPITLNKLSLVLGDSSHIFRTDQMGTIAFKWKFGKGLWPINF